MTVETLRSGIDLSHVETSVRPQDDLFGHVNGRWLAEYQMPGDRATDGAFRTLYDRAEEQVRELIMQAAAAAAPDCVALFALAELFHGLVRQVVGAETEGSNQGDVLGRADELL